MDPTSIETPDFSGLVSPNIAQAQYPSDPPGHSFLLPGTVGTEQVPPYLHSAPRARRMKVQDLLQVMSPTPDVPATVVISDSQESAEEELPHNSLHTLTPPGLGGAPQFRSMLS